MPAALDFAPPAVEVMRRPDGRLLVRSPLALQPGAVRVTDWLVRWAREAPDKPFLVEGPRSLTYAGTLERVERTAQALLDHGAGAERPVAILSDNGIDHAVVALAAQHAGVPAAPISPAYSLLSSDHAKLRAIIELLRPAVIFADDRASYRNALAALPVGDAVVWDGPALVASEREPTGAVERAHQAVGPGTVAKVLFTSGSTGEPKGVLNTHRMLCSNQQMIAQLWRFLAARPPVLVDWLPWSHTFGGNHNFNMVLAHGGTLHVDAGRPVPGRIERTVESLRSVSPTIYFNVPRGYDVLLPFLEADPALRDAFFARLDLLFYAAAALPQPLWDRLERLAIAARGHPVPMLSAWGSTETSPLSTSVHFPIPRAGVIGLPAPGVELLLVPNGEKLEMRVRGPHVTPGYFRRPDLTAEAFDEEGFYRIGDAGRFEDEARPERGLVFDGRVSESFKLSTGTWVHVGTLRTDVVAACAPLAQDVVVAGHDRNELGVLIFPSAPAARALAGAAPDTPLPEVLAHPAVRSHVAAALAAHNARARGSSERVTQAILLAEPPSIDAGEITDKGYINQRAVLARRAADVALLYAGGPAVIDAGSGRL